jgi:predicted  nucleic acid-binding Zn-ribbon protein
MEPIDDRTRLQIKCERVEKERDKFRDALWALREEFTALQMRSEKMECENAELKEAISFGLSRRKSVSADESLTKKRLILFLQIA